MEHCQPKISMKSPNLILSAFCLAFFCIPVLAEITEARLNEFRELLDTQRRYYGDGSEEQPYAKWVMSLNAEERAALIIIAKERRDKIDPRMVGSKDTWNGLLAYLGDEEAMKANIENWRRVGSETTLEVMFAESGQLPLYFEPELFREGDPGVIFSGDTFGMGQSFATAEFILRYLKHNQHYPQEVRDWADRTIKSRADHGDPTPMQRAVRRWYRSNEGFIRTKQYGRVKPGEELPPQPGAIKVKGPPPVPPLPIPEDRPPQPAPTPPPASPPVAALPPSIPEPESKATGNYAIYAAVAAVLAAIILFAGIRLARKKPRAP